MLIDKFNRKIDYIRVSVTERCNFRCAYCMPDKPFSWVPQENLLSYEDLFEFIKVAIDLGIKKVRITGGEPLIRAELDKFIHMISSYAPDIDLALTTNGYFLKKLAKPLKEAGLKRLNISLDSLRKDIAAKIAKKDILDDVFDGIKEAKKEGFKIKINSVILKNINDIEIINLLHWARGNGFEIRFIEYMNNTSAKSEVKGMSAKEILYIIGKVYQFEKIEKNDSSPSDRYKLSNGYVFGIIEPHKDEFCKSCNRVRLSAEGYLIPCLYFDDALSIADAIKKRDIKQAVSIFKKVIDNKPEKNRWGEGEISNRAFYETGG